MQAPTASDTPSYCKCTNVVMALISSDVATQSFLFEKQVKVETTLHNLARNIASYIRLSTKKGRGSIKRAETLEKRWKLQKKGGNSSRKKGGRATSP